MFYRIRMISNKWFVVTYETLVLDSLLSDYGPFDTIGEAETVAKETGFQDADKG